MSGFEGAGVCMEEAALAGVSKSSSGGQMCQEQCLQRLPLSSPSVVTPLLRALRNVPDGREKRHSALAHNNGESSKQMSRYYLHCV